MTTTTERRAADRVPATDFPPTLTCRITPGHDVRIVDLSAIGMQVESASPLFPGRAVSLRFEVHALHAQHDVRRTLVSGVVVRASMAALDRDGAVTYTSGIAFERDLHLVNELAMPSKKPKCAEPACDAPGE